MALTLENNKLVATYKTTAGKDVVSSPEPIIAGQTYSVGLLRTGKQVEIVVNGRSSLTSLDGSIFIPATSLYIGGLPPGMSPNEELSNHDFFDGCVAQM
jgi:hypothetical protein